MSMEAKRLVAFRSAAVHAEPRRQPAMTGPTKRIYLSPPFMARDERRLLLDAFDSGWVAPLGPHVDAFEDEFASLVGVQHAVALSSGTAALHLALHLLGVGPGDEVMTSTLTFAATANAITYCAAKPVFVDVQPDTWAMDPSLLREELKACAKRGRLPKAIVPVDLYGQCADYGQILAVCEEYGLPVLEDAAEALGATYNDRPAGSFGDAAIFSFNGNKIVTTSGGGMLVSRDKGLVDRARFLATQARDPAPHYQHSVIGYNYRLSNLLAAVGRGQIRTLAERVERRRQIRETYEYALRDAEGISFMPEAEYGKSNSWLTCILIEPSVFGADRESVRAHLESLNIESRPLWKPMHLQPVFADCRSVGGQLAADLFERGLCLPSGSGMTDAEQSRVIDGVLSIARQPASRAV